MREDDHSSVRTWAVILMVVATLLFLYPFSFGPMFWLCSDASNAFVGLKGKVFLVAYDPLIRLYQDGPEPIRGVLHWYIGMWER